MEVTNAYLYTVGNLPKILDAIQKAQVPEKFTHSFLKGLDFKSTNDRAFINVLKGLGFLDANSVPTAAYKEYRDKSTGKAVLARQIRVAYKGLFSLDEKANDMTQEGAKGKLATLTGKDESVVKKMAQTFKALCKEADFTSSAKAAAAAAIEEQAVESPALEKVSAKPPGLAFSHVVYINLPTTRDVAVYDAIFKSIREHLL